MKPIKFTIGEENKPKIEKFTDINDSIFREQYSKAIESIAKHIEDVNGENGYSITFEKFNNVFAFIGDRGSGKTSCMMSIAEMLKEEKCIDERFNKENSFKVLDLIDPSFFDEQFNIIEIIIGKMFKEFKNDIDNNLNYNSNKKGDKNELITAFQDVQKDLRASQKKSFEDGDSIEGLLDLASNVALKDSILNLVKLYLKYFDNKKYLVIPIDDIDLNTQHADVMVEQIRRYFVLPNVIVLMAAKLNQLSHVLNRKHFKEYAELVNKSVISSGDVEEMSERYLEKLIPTEHRIYLPLVDAFYLTPLIIKNNDGKEGDKYPTVREAVTSLIFTKTRFLFYHTNGATSFIVPSNLRELRHLVFLLYRMVDNNFLKRTNPEGALYNKDIFKKYFFETWTENNLDGMGKRIVRELVSIQEASILNKTVVSNLKENLSLSFNDSEQEVEFRQIIDKKNKNYNISLGDVTALLDYLEDSVISISDKKLVFFIRSLYSIKLYEYYDEITEGQLKVNKEKTILINDKKFEGLTNYDKIVAGNYINSNIKELFPSGYKQILNIKFDIIKLMISELDSHKENKASFEIENIQLDYDLALQIVEFFALTISRKYESKNVGSNLIYRQSKEIFYNSDLGNLRTNANFDIASIFYNITRLENSYNRIDSRLFNFAKNNENSIYNKIINKCVKYKNWYKDRYENDDDRLKYGILSWSIIRNIEILNSLLSEIEHDKYKGNNAGSGYAKKIENFFKRVCEFTVESYDKGDGVPYKIDFEFYEIFQKLMKDIPDEKNILDLIMKSKPDLPKLKIEYFNSIKLEIDSKIKYKISDIKEIIKRNYNEVLEKDRNKILQHVKTSSGDVEEPTLNRYINDINLEIDKINRG